MSTIDLRGRALDARSLRQALPRAEYDVEAALDAVRPICEDVQHRGADGAARPQRALRRRAPRPAARARRGAGRRAGRPRPRHPRRAGGVDPPGPARARGPAPHRHHHRRSSPAAPSPSAGCRSTGSASTSPAASRSWPAASIMNVVPAQAAGVGSLAVASPPQREQPGVFAGYPHPTILAACALLGVDEVYAVGGAQAIAMFAYGASEDGPDGDAGRRRGRLRAGQPGHRPGQHLRRRRQAAAQGPDRHRLRGGPDRDRDPGRRHRRPRPRRRRPDQPGRARRPRGRRSWSPTASRSPTRSQQALERRVAATKHHERVAHLADGARSPASCWSTTSTPASTVVNAYAAEHLEIQTRDAAAVAARVRNGGAVFVGPFAPVSLGDYCAGSNHVLPTGGCALPQQRAVGAVVPARHPRRRVRRGRAARGRAPRRHPGRGRGPARPRRGRHRPLRRRRLVTLAATSCCAPTCAAGRRTARRSSTCRCG